MSDVWKVEITSVDEDGFWDNANTWELKNFSRPLVRTKFGDNRDTFEFTVSNLSNRFLSRFQPRDRIIIRRCKPNEDIDADENVLLVGTIQSSPVVLDPREMTVKVQGFSFTELLLSALTFVDALELPINEALEQGINAIDSYVDNPDAIEDRYRVVWNEDNPTINTDGNPYPIVGEDVRNRPFRYLITKYSTEQATGTVGHYFFVDTSNTLVWRPMTNDVSFEINDGEKFLSLKKDIDIDGIVNFVIVRLGLDIFNKPIQFRFIDHASTSKYGQKFLFPPTLAGKAKELIDQDLNSWGVDDRGTPYSDSLPGSPLTTTWKSKAVNPPDYVTINSNVGYNNALRAHLEVLAMEEALGIMSARKYGVFEVEIEYPPSQRGLKLGDLVQFNLTGLVQPGLGADKLLRVRECSYSNQSDTFTLQEDMGTV